MQERTFRAMNTEVRVAICAEGQGAARLLERAADEFADYERTLSRFNPVSELSVLNRAGAHWVFVSPLLFRSLAAARGAYDQTDGLYNPAILPALEAAGYDRSFEQLAQPVAKAFTTAERKVEGSGAAALPGLDPAMPFELASQAQAVCLASHARLDLGGIGKGLAVDAAAAHLAGQPGFLIDAGGDLRVGGLSPDAGLWGVAVQDPFDLNRDLAVLALTDGAVATSSAGRRRWLRDGAVHHHLIDPRTGRSTASDVVAATVIAPDCATAEVWAKAMVIAGSEHGFSLLAQQRLPGLIVGTDHRVVVSDAMRPLLVEGDAVSVCSG